MWWWLSFADERRNLGVALVKAPDFGAAVLASHIHRCNPGGEINGWPFPADYRLGDPAPRWQNRLLTKEEANQMSLEWTGEPIVSTLDADVEEPARLSDRDNEGS